MIGTSTHAPLGAWGKVVLKESKTKAKVEKESAADEAVEEEEAA